MPLLCISLLVLLLLPQTLSCEAPKPAEEVQSDMVIVQPHLVNTRENITASLSNKTCRDLKHKLPNCTPVIRGEESSESLSSRNKIVETIHNLTCSMRKLRLSQTIELSRVVINSIGCHCPDSDKKQAGNSKKNGKRRRRSEHHKTTKLCRAKAILSSVTECYEMLNSLLDT